MSSRDPTKLRNQKGNHYCMNCQQAVFTKTPFNTSIYAISIFIGLLFGIVFSVGSGSAGPFLISGLISLLAYPTYWFRAKKPVCPICNARYIEKITSGQQQSDTQPNHQTETLDHNNPWGDQNDGTTNDTMTEKHKIPEEVINQDKQTIETGYDLEDANKLVRIALELDDSVQTYKESEIDGTNWLASIHSIEKATAPVAITLEEHDNQTKIILDHKEKTSEYRPTLINQLRKLMKEHDDIDAVESYLAEMKGGYIKQAR